MSDEQKAPAAAKTLKGPALVQEVADDCKPYLKTFKLALRGPGAEGLEPFVVSALCPIDAFVVVVKSLKADSTQFTYRLVE